MRGLFIVPVVVIALALSADVAKAGTLDRGVQIDSFFLAGGSPGNPMITQLKYQMAIDTRLGLKNRYTTITNSFNTYDGADFSTNNTGTFNTFNAEVSGGSGNSVTVNPNTYNNEQPVE